MAAAAFAFVVIIFVAAIANAREFYAASRAFNLIEIGVFVDANDVTTSRAFNFNEIVFAITIAIFVAAITVAVATVVFFFKSAEIFVDFFDVGIEIFGVFLEACNFLCDIAENVEDRIDNLVINGKTFCKTFDVRNFFRNVHCNSSFLFKYIDLNWK